jgi:hypothetical protein
MMKVFNLFFLLLALANQVCNADKSASIAEAEVPLRGLEFFSHFGKKLNRNKLNRIVDCDYEDPEQAKFCPPVHRAFPFARMVVQEEEEQ